MTDEAIDALAKAFAEDYNFMMEGSHIDSFQVNEDSVDFIEDGKVIVSRTFLELQSES